MSIRRHTAGAVLSIAMTLVLPALAQQQTAQPPLTLSEVLLAARDNADVRFSRQALAAARADILAADHAPVPVLSAKAASIDLQNGVGAGNLANKRIDNSIGIDWVWERGGKRRARTLSAERSAAAAEADVDEATYQQQFAAGSAFYDLLGAQERIVEVASIERGAAQLSGTATRRVQAGDLPQQEASRSAIEAQRSNVELRAAELDRDRAQIALAQLLGTTMPVRGRIAGNDWPTLAPLPALGAAAMQISDSYDTDAVVDARPDVRAAQARVAAMSAALDNARALRSSDVTWGVSLERYPGTSNRLVELRASIPLQIGYRAEGEIGRAEAMYVQSQDVLDRTRNDARLELQRLRAEADANARRLQTFERDILGGARQLAESAEFAYRRGAMSLTDVLDARRTLRATQLDAIAARIDHAKAALAWRLRTQPLTAQ
ncbi:TolC family protein [Variovorax sp. RHLX14]|uniref:TolC family protein n=1 Tax=Variovorax sp. RHLX14 TaxID=1259731 RepID=UPI003F47C43E